MQGWFDDERGARLVELAKDAPGEIVELGSAWGKSASYVLALTDRSMTCVDLWDEGTYGFATYTDGWGMFMELLRENGWEDRVTIMRMSTREAAAQWQGPIGLLHVDAGHDYENVSADYRLWSPYVVPGGAIVFDDLHEPGVRRALEELVWPDERWIDRTTVYVQWSARKAE